MLDGIKLYFRLIGAQLRSKLQYKTSFALEMIAQFLLNFLDFAEVAVLFNSFPSLHGWNIYEIAFLYGLSAISFSFSQLFVRGFEVFERYVQMGELDRVLIRPVSPFLQILAVELGISRLGRLLQGFFVLIIGLSGLTIVWTLPKIGLLLMTLVSGTLIYMGIFVIGAVSTIWTVATAEFSNMFTYGGTYMCSFPMDIYQKWFRNFFTFVIPLSFVNFLPVLIILDKQNEMNLPYWVGWLPLPIAILFFFVALKIWNWGLRKYQSTGS